MKSLLIIHFPIVFIFCVEIYISVTYRNLYAVLIRFVRPVVFESLKLVIIFLFVLLSHSKCCFMSCVADGFVVSRGNLRNSCNLFCAAVYSVPFLCIKGAGLHLLLNVTERGSSLYKETHFNL